MRQLDFSRAMVLLCFLPETMQIRKKQFHCDECGICRVGGRDKFFHCSQCGERELFPLCAAVFLQLAYSEPKRQHAHTNTEG